MGENSEVFVGLDVAKAKNAVAIAEDERHRRDRSSRSQVSSASTSGRLCCCRTRHSGR